MISIPKSRFTENEKETKYQNISKCVLVGYKFKSARLFTTPWTAAYQAPPSMGFARKEYWSGLLLPSPPTTSDIQPNLVKFPLHFSNLLPLPCPVTI